MKLFSSAFKENETIPSRYSYDGENVNPPLTIREVPEGTISLLLIMDDPDAPGGDWVHWLVWGIDPATTEITENSLPSGAITGINTAGSVGYHGPRPPSGTHRYCFKLYALNLKLDLDSSADKSLVLEEINDKVLEQFVLTGKYSKNS